MTDLISKDKSRGVILGLACGDTFGAPFEGGVIERLAWRVIGRTRKGLRRFTDDTQMSLDVAESILSCRAVDLDDMAARFASSYRWSRGYGPAAAKTLKRIRRGVHWSEANRKEYPDGSFGNGGAMRAPIFALLPHAIEGRTDAAARCAAITHAHPLGVCGAQVITIATSLFLENKSGANVLQGIIDGISVREFLHKSQEALTLLSLSTPPAKHKVAALGTSMLAVDSCITSVVLCALYQHKCISALIEFGNSLGGDTDTVLAMACAMWGAANGATKIPDTLLCRLEQRSRLEKAADGLSSIALRNFKI